jgi:hypothetical protein
MTPFTSSTKKTNMIKATSLVLASTILISNAASAIDGPKPLPLQPPATAAQIAAAAIHPWCRQINDAQMTCSYSSQEECLAVTYVPPIGEACYRNPNYTPPPPPPPSLTERFGDWISEKLDDWEQSKKDAENRRLRKIYVECQASSATALQASACYALKTGKY